VTGIKINPCRPLGRGKKIDKETCLAPLEVLKYKIEAVEETLKLRNRGAKINLPDNTACIINNFMDDSKQNSLCYSTLSCSVGSRMLAFDINGDVYPCDELVGHLQYRLGNVFDESLHDIFTYSKIARTFLSRTIYEIEKCKSCTWRNLCGGGCASSSCLEFNDLFREDPLCEFRRKYFQYVLWKLAEAGF
jgi:radical SAM protein with 4Fe4S-binding SPASM domain